MHTLLRTSLLLLCVAIVGCASNTSNSGGGTEAAPASEDDANSPRLVVSNRASLDMDIYAVRSGGSARVGFAPASETTTFKLTAGLLAGTGGVIRFEARPARRAGQAVLSEPYAVAPGTEITWDIPPQ